MIRYKVCYDIYRNIVLRKLYQFFSYIKIATT